MTHSSPKRKNSNLNPFQRRADYHSDKEDTTIPPRGAHSFFFVCGYIIISHISRRYRTNSTMECRISRRGTKHRHKLYTSLSGLSRRYYAPANPAYRMEMQHWTSLNDLWCFNESSHLSRKGNSAGMVKSFHYYAKNYILIVIWIVWFENSYLR